jgi:hypothetical protein
MILSKVENVVVLTICPSLCVNALFTDYLELLRRDTVDQTIFVGRDFGGLEGRCCGHCEREERGRNATRRAWMVLVVSRGLPWGMEGRLRQTSGSSDGQIRGIISFR